METTKVFQWQNYELQCTARPLDAGRFAPDLVVAKRAWPSRPRQIAVPRGAHQSEAAAIDAAYAQGIEWIRDYG